MVIVACILAAIFGVGGLLQREADVGKFRTAEGYAAYKREYDAALADMPTPKRVLDVPTDFGTVHAYEWSTPETAHSVPVVLLPGRASGAPMWAENLAGFARQHRVIAFDAIGDAGLSTQRIPLTDTTQQAQWVHQTLMELAPKGAHIVGHSFGGATAATYAHQYPDDVKTLTLLEPAFVFSYPPASVLGWSAITQLPGLPQSAREYALSKISGSEYSAETPVARMIDVGSKEYSAALPTPHPLIKQEAAELRMPVYVAIAGKFSLAGSADIAKELIPHAHVKVWPDTTHSLPMEVASPLADELAEFWGQS
ncbi:alpha/beta fold hydrolase [Corynebacterium sp.]|uniref:alpha/beta fold hydrolase n=1 Tax=Corynebacterium sp. TaxID=1720 RepID=UPI0026DC8509|nr:alpha/beta fold hydrolase [Corynebacterium sp.]MDO5077373.1 alpha/beta fold hydrolase [Corynebacterium sp.]